MSGRRDESSFAYPETEVQDVEEARFGVVVRDPYRWLEADIRSDPKVRAWVDAQGKATDDYISQLPHRQAIARRLREILNLELYWAPRKKGNRYFFQHNSGGQNQSTLMVQDGLGGIPRVLLDPNSWTSDGATALSEWEPSPDGKHLAYAIQEAGSDWRMIRVLDVDTGKIRGDELHWVRFTSPVWSKDGSGFFYARYPEPTRGAEHQSCNFDHGLCFHALGTDQSTDRLVFSIAEEPQLLHFFKATDDGRFLVISSVRNAEPNARVTSIDLDEPGWKPRTLVSNWDNAYALAGNQGDTLYFVTDRNALKGAVVMMSATASSSPVTLIPEGPHTLASAAILGGKLVVSYIVDARSELQVFDLSGCLVSRLALPGVGSITALEGKQNDGEAFYSFESFVQPSTVYRLDVKAGTSSVFKQPTTSFDRSTFTVRQLFYRSKDGTRVPMFVAHRKGLDLSIPRPALLYGYGGYNISILPTFRGAWVQWMEMGGICALANLRGGGEYGKSWHDAGRLLNKQNVFDDFIAGAEYLIAEKLTTPEQLAIQGASNGGLLIGAVVNQRPELFAVALAQVGVMDMLRFDQFTVGRYWTSDFGSPAEEKHFRNLLSYSPYHNIKSGRAYPAILTTTADTDDRVVPSHSFKYAAALQAAQIGSRPHLLRIDTRAGHGLGKPLGKAIDEASDLWAFAGYFTGLTTA